VEETAEWLKSVGFDDYVTTRFIGESITCILPGSELLYVFLLSTDEEIDGDCLLAMANEERLEKIRIAKMTTRLKLVKNIKSFNVPCVQLMYKPMDLVMRPRPKARHPLVYSRYMQSKLCHSCSRTKSS
jgi:hypothetical protein